MQFFISKYLRRPARRESGENRRGPKKKDQEAGEKKTQALSPYSAEESHACAHGCFPAPLFGLAQPHNPKHSATTTARITRSNFAKSTTSSVFPNTTFTNHESLPPLPDAFSKFTAVYPKYAETHQADRLREREYRHLSNHVCLDYTGFSLFSHAQMMNSSMAPSSSSEPPPSSTASQPPFFSISYKSASLESQVQGGNNQVTALESAMRKRIMGFLNISDEEYSMVLTSNRAAAFKLLAESYPFHNKNRLLTVYDFESEAVSGMAESAQKRGAKVMSASFAWPSLRIHSARLKQKVGKRNKKQGGLFVFPLQSRITGAKYSYLWMSLAKENGWHVVLDACGLGPKDMDTMGLTLVQPDFIICSFFKVLGENPSGFAGLFIKKSTSAVLETSKSNIATSIGTVSIIPARRLSQVSADDHSGTDLESQSNKHQLEEDDVETTSSFSGPMPAPMSCNPPAAANYGVAKNPSSIKQKPITKNFERGETSETGGGPLDEKEELDKQEPSSSEIMELESENNNVQVEKTRTTSSEVAKRMEIECKGLDHADSLGLLLISSRLRCITNWLVVALMKLRHPHSGGHALVRIYGPRVKFDRGPALAFNVFDWKGEKVDPALLQKLADRNNLSLSCGFLQHIWFSEKYEAEKDVVLERRIRSTTVAGNRRRENINDLGINVVSASLSFLTNFEDAYRLWAFVAKFLDADFIEKERWRYMALNQKMVEV